MKKIKAFTLVELLIASAIFALVMVSIYSAFRTGIFGYKNIQESIDTYQSARFIFNRVNLDLRNAFSYSNDTASFTGSKEGMNFYSLVDTFSGGVQAQDYAFIKYELRGGKLLRTCYKNTDTITKGPEIQPQELPGNIDSLTFSYAYMDSTKKTLEWKDAWMMGDNPPADEKKTLPLAVKINLRLKNRGIEEFERTVFLPLADKN